MRIGTGEAKLYKFLVGRQTNFAHRVLKKEIANLHFLRYVSKHLGAIKLPISDHAQVS